MKLGTIIKLPDGRTATVVYNGLDGVGIKMGEHIIPEDDLDLFRQSSGGLFSDGHISQKFRDEWKAEYLLRKVEDSRFTDIPCIGDKFEIIRDGIKL